MLRLRPNVLSKRHIYFAQLLLFVLSCHLLLAILFFACYRNYHEYERFEVSSQRLGSTVVFMPLQKKVDVIKYKHVQNNQKIVTASKVMDLATYQNKVKQQEVIHKKQQTEQVKLSIQEMSSQKKMVQQEAKPTLQIKEQAIPKQVQKKIKPKLTVVEQPIISKKQLLKPQAQKSQLKVQEKIDKKPSLEAKEVVKKQEVQQIVAEVKQSVRTEKKLQQQSVKNKIEEKQEKAEKIDLDDVTFIGREQLDSLYVQDKIAKAVQQHWKAPVGMTQQCEFAVKVAAQGQATSVSSVLPSGVLAYDIAARTALYKVEYPREVWNKEIVVLLGP